MIEGYGAEGALCLSDRFCVNDLLKLMEQTCWLRKTDQERLMDFAKEEEEELRKKSQANPNAVLNIPLEKGQTQQLKLSDFFC